MNTVLPLLAAISGEAIVSNLIWIIVVGVIIWLLYWLIGFVGLPEPFRKVAYVILAVASVIFLINLLLSIAGHPLFTWR